MQPIISAVDRGPAKITFTALIGKQVFIVRCTEGPPDKKVPAYRIQVITARKCFVTAIADKSGFRRHAPSTETLALALLRANPVCCQYLSRRVHLPRSYPGGAPDSPAT